MRLVKTVDVHERCDAHFFDSGCCCHINDRSECKWLERCDECTKIFDDQENLKGCKCDGPATPKEKE
jgi:hypothetical protein